MSVCSTLQLQQVSCPQSYSSNAENPWDAGMLAIKWYAVFTLSNHEKRVLARCTELPLECLLPLYKVRRKWKNGCTVSLELPLFPNYFFVRIAPRDRVRVLELPGVVSIVSSGRELLPIPDDYITSLRDALLVHKIEPHPNVEAGERVRIKTGPLAGTEGVLERRKNDLRVVLRLEMLARSVSVEVDAEQVEWCGSRSSQFRSLRDS
jgi:transcription antitermination factor NusG